MKTVKKISVKVTYKVGLGGVKMPENVYKQLKEASEKGDGISVDNIKYNDACEWILNNIKERDCFDHRTEIDDIS